MSSPTPLLVVWWSVYMRNLWVWLHGVDLPLTSMRGSPWWESGEASVIGAIGAQTKAPLRPGRRDPKDIEAPRVSGPGDFFVVST